MSDYGFATYDDRNDKKRLGSINSKWPIFGPKYKDISRCFKTVHLVDTYTPGFKTADLPAPVIPSGDPWAYNDYRWHEKQLIHRFEHGYDKRPLGYAVFSGNLVINVDCTITQVETRVGERCPSYGGNFTLNGRNMSEIPILPSVSDQMKESILETSLAPNVPNIENYLFTIWSQEYTEYWGISPTITVPNNSVAVELQTYYVASNWITPDTIEKPYVVEIDDKYVNIYRNLYWLDFRSRWYSELSGYGPPYDYTLDIYDRIKGATSFAGTTLDCTVYLAPYSMEDLL